MVSAVSCILELHFLSRVSSGKGTDVYRAFKTAVTLVSPGRGVAGSQGMLSSPCVRGPCFLLLAKVLHGITSKVLLWPRLQRFSTVSLSSCFIFENDSSKTEIPIQCHIRHGRFSLVERTMAWQSRGQPLFLVCSLTGCMALGKSLSPLCASAFPLTPCLSFSFCWLAPPGKECLLFVQFPVFCWRPWGLQPCNNRDSHQYYHLSLIYSSEEPNFHKGMNVPGPCVNSIQQGAIMTKNFSFWCVRAITSPGLRSGLMQVFFLLMLVSVTQECDMSHLCRWPKSEMCSVSTWSDNQLALHICKVCSWSGLEPCSKFWNSWFPVWYVCIAVWSLE